MKRVVAVFLGLFLFCISALADNVQNTKAIELQKLRAKNAAILDKLASGPILRVELVTSGPNFKQMGSQFGHNLLRFVIDPENPLNDIVIGVEAFINDEHLSIKKGIFGGYVPDLNVMTMEEFMQQYYFIEHRWERFAVIAATGDQKAKLVEIYRSINLTPEKIAGTDYTFAANNCTVILWKIFEEANILPKYSDMIAKETWIQNQPLALEAWMRSFGAIITPKYLMVPWTDARLKKNPKDVKELFHWL